MMKAFVVQGVDVLGGKVDLDHRDGRAEDVVLLEVPEPVSLRSPTSQDNPQSQAAGSITSAAAPAAGGLEQFPLGIAAIDDQPRWFGAGGEPEAKPVHRV